MNDLNLYWWNVELNVGDALNPYLVTKLVNKDSTVSWVNTNCQKNHYLCIGSVIDRANRFTTVWGSGLLGNQSKFLPKEKPFSIRAVRGPLTRQYLQQNDIDCPEVYGDPGILTSTLYKPKSSEKKYDFGIIPHFVDRDNAIIKKLETLGNVKIIDVRTDNIEFFVDTIMSCRMIFSSSLHGLIFADSYGIPNLWTTFNSHFWNRSRVIGNGFKFRDYFLSVNRKQEKSFNLNNVNDLDKLSGYCEIGETSTLFDPLLSAMPFNEHSSKV